jgi:hypothetical protein
MNHPIPAPWLLSELSNFKGIKLLSFVWKLVLFHTFYMGSRRPMGQHGFESDQRGSRPLRAYLDSSVSEVSDVALEVQSCGLPQYIPAKSHSLNPPVHQVAEHAVFAHPPSLDVLTAARRRRCQTT